MKPEKRAVALRYNYESDNAPVIIKKARCLLVDKLRQIAEEYNITVYQDCDLANALYALPENQEISPDLYQAVAEVIAYCYNLNSGTGANR